MSSASIHYNDKLDAVLVTYESIICVNIFPAFCFHVVLVRALRVQVGKRGILAAQESR